MRKNVVNLVGIIVRPFMFYIAPQSRNSFSSTQYSSSADISAFYSEIFCLLILVFALTSIAIISPVLCFGSLLVNFHIDYLWYFWLITLTEIGYFMWLIIQKKLKK